MAQRSMMEEMDVAKLHRAALSLTSAQCPPEGAPHCPAHRASSVAPGGPFWCLGRVKKHEAKP